MCELFLQAKIDVSRVVNSIFWHSIFGALQNKYCKHFAKLILVLHSTTQKENYDGSQKQQCEYKDSSLCITLYMFIFINFIVFNWHATCRNMAM